jgi:hypothetical protein
LALALALASLASAQERIPLDPQLAAASARYEAAGWPKGELRAGFDLSRQEFAGFRGDELDAGDGGPLLRPYRDDAGRTRFLIELTVADTVQGAHDALLAAIAFVTTPKMLPTAERAGVPVGDVGYVGFSGAGPGRIAWVAFVRGNLCARLVCTDASADLYPDMPRLARELDAGLQAAPPLSASDVVPHPPIDRLELERSSCTAGDVVRIDLKMPEGAWVSWAVGGPGQGYVEKGKDGASYLHTTGPGQLTLKATVTSALGTRTSRSVTLAVARD